MATSPACVHAIDGRLRIKVTRVKRSPEQAREIEAQLCAHDGITEVQANPTTGSVVICYDSRVIQASQIFGLLRCLGWLREDDLARSSDRAADGTPVHYTVAQKVVTAVMETALKGLVSGLV